MKYTWKKREHLKSRKAIDLLFKEGDADKKFPVRLVYRLKTSLDDKTLTKQSIVSQAGFSVPKKLHKSAVVRNKIKRQMREAYRTNKYLAPPSYHLFFIYYSKDKLSYDAIEDAIIFLLNKIKD